MTRELFDMEVTKNEFKKNPGMHGPRAGISSLRG